MNMSMSETITKLAPALLKAQQEMGEAVKGAKNPFFKSSFADLNSIREAVLPAFNKNGIAVLQPTVVVDGKNYVNTLLLHESGEYIGSLTEIKVAKANDAQAEGSGISYARRYGLQSMANVGAKDDDGEAAVDRQTKATKVSTISASTLNTDTPNGTDVTQKTPENVTQTANGTKSTFRKSAKKEEPKTTTEDNGWQ